MNHSTPLQRREGLDKMNRAFAYAFQWVLPSARLALHNLYLVLAQKHYDNMP